MTSSAATSPEGNAARLGVSLLREQVAWVHWVIGHLFDLADGLPDERLDAPTAFAHGSLRRILRHLVDVDRSWGYVLLHHSMADAPESDFPDDLSGMRALWQAYAEEIRVWLTVRSAIDLATSFVIHWPEGDEVALPHVVLQHMTLHAMQHASEAAQLLTEAGRSPGDIDFVDWRGGFDHTAAHADAGDVA